MLALISPLRTGPVPPPLAWSALGTVSSVPSAAGRALPSVGATGVLPLRAAAAWGRASPSRRAWTSAVLSGAAVIPFILGIKVCGSRFLRP